MKENKRTRTNVGVPDEYAEKVRNFKGKTLKDKIENKTSINDLPIMFRLHSSSCPPDEPAEVMTADMVLWVKFLDEPWCHVNDFLPQTITNMIRSCENDMEVEKIIRLILKNGK